MESIFSLSIPGLKNKSKVVTGSKNSATQAGRDLECIILSREYIYDQENIILDITLYPKRSSI